MDEVRIFCMEVWFNPPIDPTIVDIRMILNVKVLIAIKYDINIVGAAFCAVINSAHFSRLNPSITPRNHQWSGAAPLFSKIGVQMNIGVNRFLSNVNRSSANVFITTIKISVVEASIFTTRILRRCNIQSYS